MDINTTIEEHRFLVEAENEMEQDIEPTLR